MKKLFLGILIGIVFVLFLGVIVKKFFYTETKLPEMVTIQEKELDVSQQKTFLIDSIVPKTNYLSSEVITLKTIPAQISYNTSISKLVKHDPDYGHSGAGDMPEQSEFISFTYPIHSSNRSEKEGMLTNIQPADMTILAYKSPQGDYYNDITATDYCDKIIKLGSSAQKLTINGYPACYQYSRTPMENKYPDPYNYAPYINHSYTISNNGYFVKVLFQEESNFFINWAGPAVRVIIDNYASYLPDFKALAYSIKFTN